MTTASAGVFRSHPLLHSGHLQTVVAAYLTLHSRDEVARRHRVAVADGDQIILHDDQPANWRPGERVVLMIHGLVGCYKSPYLKRMVCKLNARGVRTFRMDQRGCGAGAGLARYPYHSGRSDDVRAACHQIEALCPGSPISVVGYSLGGNLALKMMGEDPAAVPANVDRAAAICPPLDLNACVSRLESGWGRLYDRYFSRLCTQEVIKRATTVPGMQLPREWLFDSVSPQHVRQWKRAKMKIVARPDQWLVFRPPAGMREFDDQFTSPVCGYQSAEHYYDVSSGGQFVSRIDRPTLILAAENDPMIPVESIRKLELSSSVQREISPGGGHLGFISQFMPATRDRCWLDARVLEFALPTKSAQLRAA